MSGQDRAQLTYRCVILPTLIIIFPVVISVYCKKSFQEILLLMFQNSITNWTLVHAIRSVVWFRALFASFSSFFGGRRGHVFAFNISIFSISVSSLFF